MFSGKETDLRRRTCEPAHRSGMHRERASVGHDDQVVLLSSPRRKIDARRPAGDQSGRTATRKRVRAQAPQTRLDGTSVVCSSTPGRAFSLSLSPSRPPSFSHPPSISFSFSPSRFSSLRARQERREKHVEAVIFEAEIRQHRRPRVSKSS